MRIAYPITINRIKGRFHKFYIDNKNPCRCQQGYNL